MSGGVREIPARKRLCNLPSRSLFTAALSDAADKMSTAYDNLRSESGFHSNPSGGDDNPHWTIKDAEGDVIAHDYGNGSVNLTPHGKGGNENNCQSGLWLSQESAASDTLEVPEGCSYYDHLFSDDK